MDETIKRTSSPAPLYRALRPGLWLLGLLCLAALGFFAWQSFYPVSAAEDWSVHVAHRDVAKAASLMPMPDGSLMDLNSRSMVAVHYVKGQRGIELKQGEAMFSVEHDTSRPFVVSAGAGQVTVTGTRFDVRRDDDQTRVVVEAGTVKVQGRTSDAVVTLTAGRGTHVDDRGQVAAAYAVNPEELTAWRTGKLVFNNATLGEVAREVSRYREQPLRVSTPAVSNLRLTSVFKSTDTDALLKALPHILPVALRTLPDGSQEIISR